MPEGPLSISAYTADSVSLSWHPPAADTSTVPITSYRVEKREATRPYWDSVGSVDVSDTSYTIRKLRRETDYMFRVIAENAAGASAPLVLEKPFVPRSQLGKFTTLSRRHSCLVHLRKLYVKLLHNAITVLHESRNNSYSPKQRGPHHLLDH